MLWRCVVLVTPLVLVAMQPFLLRPQWPKLANIIRISYEEHAGGLLQLGKEKIMESSKDS